MKTLRLMGFLFGVILAVAALMEFHQMTTAADTESVHRHFQRFAGFGTLSALYFLLMRDSGMDTFDQLAALYPRGRRKALSLPWGRFILFSLIATPFFLWSFNWTGSAAWLAGTIGLAFFFYGVIPFSKVLWRRMEVADRISLHQQLAKPVGTILEDGSHVIGHTPDGGLITMRDIHTAGYRTPRHP